MAVSAFPLNPAQQSVIDLLGRSADREPLPEGLHAELRDELDGALEPLAGELDPADPLWVSKHALTTIHGCEAHHRAGQGDFEWTTANSRGIVAHRAIEVMINFRGEPHPHDLVDEAIARMIDDERSDVGRFLARLPEFDRAELRSQAVNHVARFQDCFPPLKPAWRPRTESRVYHDVLGGRIRLSGKVDLTLGPPGEKVIIDLKSGFPAPSHREDLRFYALLETLSLGAPPRKLASYYLEPARTHPEDVSEAVLRTALRRTIDGIERIVAVMRLGLEPKVRPGPQCRWCPLHDECDEGRAALARAADPDATERPW